MIAFTDAVFDGHAILEGVRAVREDDLEAARETLTARDRIPTCVQPLPSVLAVLEPQVVVDARVMKHSAPEDQHGLAPLTIALGPGLVAGRHADVVIETSWDNLGRVITEGATLPLSGEPRAIDGHARDRYVYAPVAGLFQTSAHIGDRVHQGQEVARIGSTRLTAPLNGVLRGLTRDAVPVAERTKVIEIDPRGRLDQVCGIAERPHRIAHGVLSAIREWQRTSEA